MSGGTDEPNGADGPERDAAGSWPAMPDRPPEADDATPATGMPGPDHHPGYEPSVPPRFGADRPDPSPPWGTAIGGTGDEGRDALGSFRPPGAGDGPSSPPPALPPSVPGNGSGPGSPAGYGPPPGYGPPDGYGPPPGYGSSTGYGPSGYPPANYPPSYPPTAGWGYEGGFGGPYGAPGYGYPYAYQYPPQQRTDGLAAGALAASILGIMLTCFCVGIAGAIAGIIMGNIARRRIRASNGMLVGDGIALAAIIIGAIDVMLTVIWFIYVVAQ